MDISTSLDVTSWINNIQDQSIYNANDADHDNTPNMEMQFENEDDAYNFYNAYARRKGFGIRKEYRNLSKKDGVLTSRKFSCHKEGERGKDKRDYLTRDERAETRISCHAHMTISLNRKISKYKIVDFVAEHNHLLQPPSYVHMIRSQRRITESQGAEIEMANQCGLSIRDFHEFMARKAGSRDNLGFMREDQKNYLRTKRNHTFKFGEVSALLKYFKQQAKEDPSFFYEFQMDVEDKITNIFWANAQMINDYRYFGDVNTFDTTYRTNKDYRPLGVFVGYNNHTETVIFGATLLYDESIPSFEWLFETFLKAMGGKRPKTIMTDQSAAMLDAISTVMPQTFHGLCTWHIRQNALRHVNHLYHNNPKFSRDFEACIDAYEKEEDFLRAWDKLLVEYDIPSTSWPHTIYKEKEKWAWAYVNKTFTAGMRSTHLSESLNSDLKSHLKSDINIVEFFTHFERVDNSKRYNESKVEHDSIHKLPRLKMKKAPMLAQAANIYTPKIFEEFQEDYEEYLGAYIQDHKEDQLMHVYTIRNVNETKERMVTINASEGISATEGINASQGVVVFCKCRKFETHGILCSHALKVLDTINIKLLPEGYILKRWTRDARRGRKDDLNDQHKELDRKTHFTNRYRELCPRFGNLVNRACESHETYNFMSKVCEQSAKIVEQMLANKHCAGEEHSNTCNISISITSEGPQNNGNEIDYSNVKGIKKRQNPYKGRGRPKSWLEKTNQKALKQRKKKTSATKENPMIDSTTKSKAKTVDTQKQFREISALFFLFSFA